MGANKIIENILNGTDVRSALSEEPTDKFDYVSVCDSIEKMADSTLDRLQETDLVQNDPELMNLTGEAIGALNNLLDVLLKRV